MKEIKLTKGKTALIDDSDFDLVGNLKWCVIQVNRNWYAQRKGGVYMHRLIMNPPNNMEVDHIDGNGLNNRRHNLRICSARQNQGNKKRAIGSASIYKGVFYSKSYPRHNIRGCWKAMIAGENLGNFQNEINAARTYDKAAIKHFGEYARLNFPQGQWNVPTKDGLYITELI